MSLIGILDDGTAFSIADSPYTIPAGVTGSQLVFQANDGSLSDNRGSIAFKVCVQSGSPEPVTTWCQVFDFTSFAFGDVWGLQTGEGGEYVDGEGWVSTNIGPTNSILIKATLPTTGSYTEYTVNFFTADSGSYYVYEEGNTIDGGGLTGGDQSVTYSASITQPGELKAQGYGSHSYTIKAIILKGTGVNPFGANNC